MRIIFAVGIAAYALMLTGCASSMRDLYKAQVPTASRPLSNPEKAALKKALSKDMKDPDATQFKWMPVAYDSASEKADYCGLVNGKNSYGGYVGFHLFRAALIRNVKGEYDTGTIIQIDENTTGDDVVEEMFSKALIDFCKRAGYTDISQAN